jgi:hypothetical protein
MSGGKGGGSTTSVEVPEYIERAAQRNLNKAEGISQIGYTPYYGPDVAAFTPSQQAAFQNTADSAGAFGMSAPTSQRDIMGGMDAPTTYANGVSGYSSAPMFQQSLDQLEANRPGQKDYIDSFFVDPFTGRAGSNVSAPVNYEDFMTSAESGRREAEANRANELAIANANNAGNLAVANANNDRTGGNSALSGYDLGAYNPTSTNPYGDYGADYTGGNVALTEYDLGSHYPTSTDPYGDYSQVTPTNYTGIKDMFDGGGAGSEGDTYSGGGVVSDLGNSLTTSVDLPGNVFSRALNIGAGKKDDSDDGYAGSSNDGTVLCTAYCNMGYLPREIYKLDRRYGVSLYRNDPSLILGYRKWATPIAEFIKTDTLAAKATRAVMWPIVKAWAEQMAHEMKPQKYSRNIAGKAIMLVGVPFSRFVGAVFVDKSVSKEAF